MRLFLSIALGKIISTLTKLFHIGAGSAAPGLYALGLDPNLVGKLSSKINTHIVITGTNGKTTTARMLAHFNQHKLIIRNATGSNLERGIASALISSTNLFGKVPKDAIGIWEVDEAALSHVVKKIKPQIVVFLNVFRDQLDRYGEIDSVVAKWTETISGLDSKTIVLINGDDHNIYELSKSFGGKSYFFGVKDYKIVGESIKHIKEQESLDFEALDIKQNGLDSTLFKVKHGGLFSEVELPIPGIYNVYNFLAAFGAGLKLGLNKQAMIESIRNYSPAFGRVEKFHFAKNQTCYIFLIKNPAGTTQVFETVKPQLLTKDRLLIALNDNFADGTDVSWIWDADFETLLTKYKTKPSSLEFYISGTRASDMAVRLKYAGFDTGKITIEENLEDALNEAKRGLKGRLFIFPTYTAMLKLQDILYKQGVKNPYWVEI